MRIDWGAYSGDDVEAVMACMLYSEQPRSVRIRPSRGDYGIDILAPDENKQDVYQVKKFASNLTVVQKRQIEESFRRILVALVRGKVRLGNWILTMPLDPTNENLEWFNAMPDRVFDAMQADGDDPLNDGDKAAIGAWLGNPGEPRPHVSWKGRHFFDVLASRYPNVVDYYLQGGRDTLAGAVSDLAGIISTDSKLRGHTAAGPLLTPAEAEDHLKRLHKVLDTDPHYRYGISMDPMAPAMSAAPGMVAAARQVWPDGSSLTVRIFPRFAEALNERPIPLKVQYTVKKGSPQEAAVRDWIRYGKPLQMEGSVSADLPGGLGGDMSTALIDVSAANGGTEFRRRDRVTAPDGTVLAEVSLVLRAAVGLEGGAHIVGTDQSGVLRIETFYDPESKNFTVNFSLGETTDLNPVDILPGLTFAAHLHSPNRYEIAGPYGPFRAVDAAFESEGLFPEQALEYIRALAAIQEQTSTPITVPDLGDIQEREFIRTLEAGSLASGKTVVSSWVPVVVEQLGADLIEGEDYEVSIAQAFTVKVGGKSIPLGYTITKLLSATPEKCEDGTRRMRPLLNDAAHIVHSMDDDGLKAGRIYVAHKLGIPGHRNHSE